MNKFEQEKNNRIYKFNSTLEYELTWKGGEYVHSSFYSYQWASFTVSPQPERTKKWSNEWVQDGVMQRQMHGKLLFGEAAATPAPPCQPEGGRHPPPQRLSLSTFSCKVIFTFIIIISSSGGSSSWARGKAVLAASLSLSSLSSASVFPGWISRSFRCLLHETQRLWKVWAGWLFGCCFEFICVRYQRRISQVAT